MVELKEQLLKRRLPLLRPQKYCSMSSVRWLISGMKKQTIYPLLRRLPCILPISGLFQKVSGYFL